MVKNETKVRRKINWLETSIEILEAWKTETEEDERDRQKSLAEYKAELEMYRAKGVE